MQYTEEYLLEKLIEYQRVYNETPTQRGLQCNDDYPNVGYYIKRFGSWNNAKLICGLKLANSGRNVIQDVDQIEGIPMRKLTKMFGLISYYIIANYEKIPLIELYHAFVKNVTVRNRREFLYHSKLCKHISEQKKDFIWENYINLGMYKKHASVDDAKRFNRIH